MSLSRLSPLKFLSKIYFVYFLEKKSFPVIPRIPSKFKLICFTSIGKKVLKTYIPLDDCFLGTPWPLLLDDTWITVHLTFKQTCINGHGYYFVISSLHICVYYPNKTEQNRLNNEHYELFVMYEISKETHFNAYCLCDLVVKVSTYGMGSRKFESRLWLFFMRPVVSC